MKPDRIKRIEDCLENLRSVYDSIESVKEDEECAYDNLPEAMQDGERGDAMQDNIDNLDDALCDLEEAIDMLDEVSSDANNKEILEVEPWDKLEPGIIVTHKSFGKGVITDVEGKYITVEFIGKVSKFIANDAFTKGFLKL